MVQAEYQDHNRDRLLTFCRRNHILRLMLFGSRLRGEERPDSDLDLLVEFQPGHVPGFAFSRLQDELSDLLGCRVDLHTPGMISRYFRDNVMAGAKVLYAES